MDDEPIGEAVDKLAAKHDRVTGKRPLQRKAPDFEAEARAFVESVEGDQLGIEIALTAEYRRMYEAGLAVSAADAGRGAVQRGLLLALADRWELDVVTFRLLEADAVGHNRRKFWRELARVREADARDLRAVLAGDT